MTALSTGTSVVGETGSTEREDIERVTPEFFSLLGIPLAMGRAFHESEMTYQTDQEVILTDWYWREHFNADPNVLEKSVRSDGLRQKNCWRAAARFSFSFFAGGNLFAAFFRSR